MMRVSAPLAACSMALALALPASTGAVAQPTVAASAAEEAADRQAWCEADAPACALLDTAIATSFEMDHDVWVRWAVFGTAGALIDIGRPWEALDLLDNETGEFGYDTEALWQGLGFEHAEHEWLALALRAQIAAGLDDGATRSLERIRTLADGSDKPLKTFQLIKSLADAGLVDEARARAADAISQFDDGTPDFDLVLCAELLVHAGLWDEARTLALLVKAAAHRNQALVVLGIALAEDGQVGAAWDRLAEMVAEETENSDPETQWRPDEILSAIASAYADADHLDYARETAGRIGSEVQADLSAALCSIAIAEARAGEIDQALQTADAIPGPNLHAICLGRVAARVSAAGDPRGDSILDRALALAEEQSASLTGELRVRIWIGGAFADVGLGERARDLMVDPERVARAGDLDAKFYVQMLLEALLALEETG